MKQRLTNFGRLTVVLYADDGSGQTCWFVHRLVLTAFVGPCPTGLECCHNDGEATNNVLANLRWDTRESNNADRITHGDHKGEKNGRAKLTWEAVRMARSSGMKADEVMAMWGVKRAAANYMLSGTTWRE